MYPPLRALRISNLNTFKVYYSPFTTPFRYDLETLETSTNPLRTKVSSQYENLPKDTLRWKVFAAMSVKTVPKTVLRERLRRRHREAFREALRLAGYNKDGKRLVDLHGSSKMSSSLQGTCEIHVHSGAGLQLGFPVLIDQAGLAIAEIASMSEKTALRQDTGRNDGVWRWSMSGERNRTEETRATGPKTFAAKD